MNDIVFTLEKTFTAREVQELFLSVNWISGKYPQRLYKALMGSSTVVTARHGDLLVGLARAVDDGELLAYIHYVLVRPEYHGRGIASKMIELLKKKYENYLYIEVMPEDSKNIGFYKKCGFSLMNDGAAMQLCNFSDER